MKFLENKVVYNSYGSLAYILIATKKTEHIAQFWIYKP